MAEQEKEYQVFLNTVDSKHQEFVNEIHSILKESGCKAELKRAKIGYLVSYTKEKKVLANYVFRKSGLIIRIYGTCVNQYLEFMNKLPDEMKKAIDKAPVCKRMIDPDSCNPKCAKGYDFEIGSKHFQKCRYNAFMFLITEESKPFVKEFLDLEIRGRQAS